jgi:hypothetical protein
MSSETPPQGTLVPLERAAPQASRGSSLVSVLWGLTGLLVGVVLGAGGVGENLIRHLTSDGRQAREVSELSSRLGELRHDITARERELSAERLQRKEAVSVLKDKLEATEWDVLAAANKGELLARFLAYEQSKSDSNRRLLVEGICSSRAQNKSARMTLRGGPLELSRDELRRGLSTDIEEVLKQRGVPADLLARVRGSSESIQMPAVTAFNVFEVQRAAQARRFAMRDEHEAIAALRRHVQNIRQAKAVRFSDGAEVAIPHDAARLMLSRQDCQVD